MAARPENSAAWNATALTKFRVPRLRRDTVERPTLLARLTGSVTDIALVAVSVLASATAACALVLLGSTVLAGHRRARGRGGQVVAGVVD